MNPHRRILVVDDTDDVREMYAEYLTFRGYEAVTAANGREAIEKAGACVPVAIIMDLAMPVLDGWEATKILKSDPRFANVPILVVTGNALAVHIEHAMNAGAEAVLRKPCRPDDMVTAVEHALRGEPIPRHLCAR